MNQVTIPVSAYLEIPTSTAQNVGDIHSKEKGTAARYNAGKVPLELIPLRVIADYCSAAKGPDFLHTQALYSLANFQEGGGADCLHAAFNNLGCKWDDCAAVFDYGRKKYAEWNWAKGFKWSVPLACAARHILYGLMAGEENDPESGLPHKGHVACNIVMLLTFMRTFPEGDDRPKGLLS